MKPLIDGDMLLYEVCFGVQYKGDDGEVIISPFENVISLLDDKIELIYEETWGDEEPLLYLTGSNTIKKFAPEYGDEPLNYRIETAVSKPYKGNRSQDKPFHYENLVLYMLKHCNVKIAWGMEADDLICIDHLKDKEGTVRCTRDKDFKGSPGDLYGWACGKQLGFGPHDISQWEADKFFYSQLITGDTVDNIPGLPRCGPAAAAKTLADCTTIKELRAAVVALYKKKGFGKEYFLEQADLLWMCREYNEDGSPKKFSDY